jgi:hypothetical protein
MKGKDDVRAVADPELRFHVYPQGLERRDLFQQRSRIDHHSVPDHCLNPWSQNTARDQLEHEFLMPDEYRVPRVMPSLVARNGVEFLGKQVDDLAFSFIAPLCAEHNQITHEFGVRAQEIVARTATKSSKNPSFQVFSTHPFSGKACDTLGRNADVRRLSGIGPRRIPQARA